MMEQLNATVERICKAVPGVIIEVMENPSPSVQHSLLVAREYLVPVARFLKSELGLGLDYCSNVSGVDVPDRVESSKVKERRVVDGVETEIVKEVEMRRPGYLEAVYHLFSMRDPARPPLVLRCRTGDRAADVAMPSLTPVWRSCELQEREVFDLYGIRYSGHPDLRRILMWDEFEDHPMRKDYVEPDDYEYEPTPHDAVKERVATRRG
jgi:NADH-quinone oxidoreductase subunit C